MAEVTVAAKKVSRLFDYLDHIGLDAAAIGARVNLAPATVTALDPDYALPLRQYSLLYKHAVEAMQTLKEPLPWAAGVGSEAFQLMCHCMISARTLGDAIELAARYEHMLYPMIGHRVQLERVGDEARLTYHIRFTERGAALAPQGWDRAEYQDTVAKASGLLVWHGLCGWLIGRSLATNSLRINAPFLNAAYSQSLKTIFNCEPEFDADANYFAFAASDLERRLVHTDESLRHFLEDAVYELFMLEQRNASTSAAIRSLIAIDLPVGLPSFAQVAQYLNMSESSLRRRLQAEDTSYQKLKDEVRCRVAVDKLLNEDVKVADLSDYLGFTEPSSFVRSFKSWTGETPSSYRQNIIDLNVGNGAQP
ncbi:AraC family transcriptional regulator [Halioglobus maricola]|nr:AraC family transcriptional regulator [Halioglobus maricola]